MSAHQLDIRQSLAATSPAARRIAKTILNGFESYFADFQNITLGAKRRFETAAWHAVQTSSAERIDLYKLKVTRQVELTSGVTSKNIHDPEIWREAKLAYAQLVSNHSNYEIAETFFNSIFCVLFAHEHIHDRNIFVLPSRPLEEKPLPDYSIFVSYSLSDGLESTVRRILDDYQFSVPWEDLDRDVQLIVDMINTEFAPTQPTPIEQGRLEILESLFYRNKAAYLVGRFVMAGKKLPFILPFLNTEEGGIYVDTVVSDTDNASVIFSFTRSYFMVDAPIPSRFVRFLQSIMPNKTLDELYNSIGLNKHGKTEFYRRIVHHMKHSDDQFIIAPGIKGMVMTVFTLPSFDVVFKVIKDKFDPPKQVTEDIVKEKYRLVSRADRAGRMADTQEYSNFIFYRNRFSEELLEELQRVAPSKLVVGEKWVIMKHLYVERRMEPLNLYLRRASDEETALVMDEYGNSIKQMAAANIFPGDMLLKNFGVTRHGRVVFYDYDEICFLTECNFRQIPPPRNEEDEMSDKPWYSVGDFDVFPEEFRLFFSGNPKARKAFEDRHADLYDFKYWQALQESIRAGQIYDAFPYRRSRRFVGSLNAPAS